MGLVMGSQNIMGSDYGSNISVICHPRASNSNDRSSSKRVGTTQIISNFDLLRD